MQRTGIARDPAAPAAAADPPRPTVALYHHLPPGGADRAMYELVKRTAADFRYVLFEVDLGRRDPFHGADRSPVHEVVDEVRTYRARSGGGGQLGRWAVTVPSILRAERRIAADIEADPTIAAVVQHHQRFTQAPTVARRVSAPTAYFVQEPRRRSFEYALRTPTSAAGRATAFATAPLEAWARRLDIEHTRAADLLFCNSAHSAEYLWRSYGRDATVVPLGVDDETFVLPTAPRRDPEVLAVGALDPTKGHDLAIDALAAIPADRRPRLRIVHNRADAATAADLRVRAQRAGVEVDLDRDVSEAELVGRYQHATALLLTARVEPLGLTALEALACGTPVVAVREGGYRETVTDGVTGLLTSRAPQAVAAALDQILEGRFAPDPAALRAHVLQRFGWDGAVAIYRAGLCDLIAARALSR